MCEIEAIADELGGDESLSQKISIVRANRGWDDPHRAVIGERPGSESGLQSAWPRWFQSERHSFEKPLLYLFGSETLNRLQMLSFESSGRGILCNDAETRRSIWCKGVQPALPLWLASHPDCTPYDPASAHEARVILRAALQALYVDHEAGFYYLAMHDDTLVDTGPIRDEDAEAAMRGMYRLRVARDASTNRDNGVLPDIRLCGAGRTLQRVLDAADLLARDWGISAEVWSCPSYTRLAREARTAARWNMLHPQSQPQRAHIARCLEPCVAPVIAVTGYAQHIAEQIAPFAPARFVALGATPRRDTPGGDFPSTQWITVIALKALADDGVLSAQTLESALQVYDLK
ncbi:pyruvate dehydrogenase [Paraburkholderia sp. D15]|uniref:transketolase-like TK C-terminal-containing protein n=1 Tax=Paraburkholderia sp. D15 TaxID=2880218 RepID=UPI0024795D13|nr:pyruvate dehydrogenase [Paraburkholderia sp. D15]WGS52832.1 pyruvate dehydrogenase [Paraburkholderia sp. D15]